MRVLLLQTGSTLDEIQQGPGDFDRLFARYLLPGQTLIRVDVQQQPPPEPQGFAAVILSGSPAMVTDNAPWSLAVEQWVQRHADTLPTLGVCYGHQLIARALGGAVGDNPNGRQIGTHTIERVGGVDDPLFDTLPTRFPAQTTHVQSVLRLPSDAVLLARTPLDPHHAFRWGRQTWGVQFHPEFDADITRAYLRQRKADLLREGLPQASLLKACRPSPEATAVLHHFYRQAAGQEIPA